MPDALATILACADVDAPRLSSEEVATWPASDRDVLQRHGILVRAALPESIPCPGCHDGHAAMVHLNADEDGGVERYVMCPEAGRVMVSAEDVCTWTIDLTALARTVAGLLKLEGRVLEVRAGHAWRLGAAAQGPSSREVLLARRATDGDYRALVQRAGPSGRAIVLWAGAIQWGIEWKSKPPVQGTLSQMLSATDGSLRADGFMLGDLVRSHEEQLARKELECDAPEAVNRRIQRMVVSAVDKKGLDELVVGAVLSTDSYEEVGEQVGKAIHRKFSRHQVFRVIRRLGGLEAVRRRYGVAPRSAVASRGPRRR